ncbi:YdeI/OmpD-associated family protein [Pseudofulvibacter geojedonensis]|uniref:YdeI family protein n=1 Tax=Pseudofulvibacter geojedonensis TaxID=1123758 RepID=A0ABW3HZZ3_9FLAO
MPERPLLYFKNDTEWYNWLLKNHNCSKGVDLVLYKVSSPQPSMRWEEAVQVALCFGWIDSTVKKINEEKRKQYFCPRKPKSVWSKLNKTYIQKLIKDNKMHSAGLSVINAAKKDKSWFALDDVENLIIPEDLQNAFNINCKAYNNYLNFSPSYQKGYLYWLFSAKKEDTRLKRIAEIINLCKKNIKTRNNF